MHLNDINYPKVSVVLLYRFTMGKKQKIKFSSGLTHSCTNSHCPASRLSWLCKANRGSTAHYHNRLLQAILFFTKNLFHPFASLMLLKMWSQACAMWTEQFLFLFWVLPYFFLFKNMWSKSNKNAARSNTNFWWKIHFKILFVILLGIKLISDYKTACITENLHPMPS